ncbi:MAG: hypothetical protein HAW67_08090, partial [Endozoicomonadaceae bacterium]|nr:hypothetical protein [Endozoicomonadaceae bacterium]
MSNKADLIVASQFHYTSARYGYAGNAGYRVRALTESIDEEEQRILAKMGNYGNPPRNLPEAPTQSQIDELFPKAYRSVFLDSGKLAATYSFYVGLDYSNRSGNYFVHGLIIEQLPDNIWPVDIYAWQGWKRQFKADEDHEQQSFILPIANIEYSRKHYEGYSLPDLREFLQEMGEKAYHLSNMIRAVLLRQENSRALVIREELENNGLFWIACLQKAFPASHQCKLSCSSYQFDPSNCSAVNITLENTNFILGETEREYQFYVFDFVGNEYSQMKKISNDYAEIIANWMLNEPKKLSDFHQFSYWFKHQNLNEELIWMMRLFQLKSGEEFNFGENELSQILAFANSFTKDDKIEHILDIISHNTQDLVDTDDYSIIIILTSFFIKAAKQTKKNKYLTRVYKLLMHLYYAQWFKGNLEIKEDINNLRAEAKESFDIFEEQFAIFFLSEENQSELFDVFCFQEAEIFFEIIEVFIFSLTLTNKPISIKNRQLHNFIEVALLENGTRFGSLDWLFNFFASSNDAIADLVLF